jgi:hypothetical protein
MNVVHRSRMARDSRLDFQSPNGSNSDQEPKQITDNWRPKTVCEAVPHDRFAAMNEWPRRSFATQSQQLLPSSGSMNACAL